MMLSVLWSKITGKDKRKQYPDQQGSALGRLGDYIIVYPYAMHCDLPSDALLRILSPGVGIPVTVKRPEDAAQGEPMFFHPETNTRIIMRNNGDLDIFTNGNINHVVTGDYNLNATNMNITLSEDFILDAKDITLTGDAGRFTHNGNNVGDTHIHSQGSDSDGDSEADTGFPHS